MTKSDYGPREVGAALAVAVELYAVLGEWREHMCIVGGLVPRLLLAEASEPHIGSLDVDLALNFQKMSTETYTTLLRALEGAGYRQDANQPFQFRKAVAVSEGPPVEVRVDLLAGEYGGTGSTHRTQPVQDVRARKVRGCDIVFQHTTTLTVHTRLPSGALDSVAVGVADVVAFLAMKGMVLSERLRQKDCYDVYYCAKNYPGGPLRLAQRFRPYATHGLVLEGLQKIRAKFQSVQHVGPVAVADFLEIGDLEGREICIRDAYEQVTAWLDELGIEAWQEAPS